MAILKCNLYSLYCNFIYRNHLIFKNNILRVKWFLLYYYINNNIIYYLIAITKVEEFMYLCGKYVKYEIIYHGQLIIT